ncbi:GyrI-like domain-containing protein [Rossellomorea vietnamensis]|uniref:GyrI-like domain-containing protein n=1 Tax=Rossellomorea vietnamensis TaxID=218284 RepID=UPI002078B3B8|nr:GyrI-like domain-containing protein [Rossellomorea vietnamensis]
MENAPVKIKKIKIEEIKLVGFRVLCPGDQYIKEIPKASLGLENRRSEISHITNSNRQIGAFRVEESTEDEDGYWVCMEVSAFKDVPEDMVTLTVPAQSYAVYRHQGSNREIVKAYEDLHKWIETSGYKRLKARWHLELYHSWKDPDRLSVELCDTIE